MFSFVFRIIIVHLISVFFVYRRLEKEYSTLKSKEQEEQVELRVSSGNKIHFKKTSIYFIRVMCVYCRRLPHIVLFSRFFSLNM